MLWYILKKLLQSLLIYYSLAIIVFYLFSYAFPKPEEIIIGQRTDEKTKIAIKKDLGLDKPILVQMMSFINDISFINIHKHQKYNDIKHKFQINILNLGFLTIKFPYLRRSFQTGVEVNTIIYQSFQGTLILAILSIVIAAIFGIIMGAVSAIYKDQFIDRSLLFISNLGISLPSFFLAIIISWFFGFILFKYTGLNMRGNYLDISPFDGKIIVWKNLILPTLALAIRPLAVFSQLSRASVLEVINKDYIRTAKAKGLSSYRIIVHHILRNSLIPVITAISGWFASLLAGTFFVEFIFNWKGIGKVTVDALDNSDLPVLMGSILWIALLFIVINIIVDILYSILDPRIVLKS